MEILAPCGSPEHVKAAVYAGADAIYLGGYGFSARRNAVNFSEEDIREAIAFCRGFGVKVYITVNILTRDDEWRQLEDYARSLADAAPDALIVQDLGVARYLRAVMPDMPLHASTQLSIHTPKGVQLCARAGFSRVVIARECAQAALADILRQADIGIEMFVHGALCVSVSGQCELSAMIGGRSGNRGLCAQPCRLDFHGGGQTYALSLKDLSLVDKIPLLKEMGVCALKIEGRMKRPEYVAAAVSACRAALAGERAPMDELRAAFSRGGFTQGYFSGRHEDMQGVRSQQDVLETAAALPQLAQRLRAPARRVTVTMELTACDGQPCRLTVSDGDHQVTVTGAAAVRAETRATTQEEATSRLARLGSTPFTLAQAQIHIEPGLFLPDLNALRRAACDKLLALRRQGTAYPCRPYKGAAGSCPPPRTPLLRVHCHTAEQANAVKDEADQIVLPVTHARQGLACVPADKLLIALDRFVTHEEGQLTGLKDAGVTRLLCENPAHVLLGRETGFALHGGLGLNLFNSEAAAFWSELGLCDLTASLELKLSEALTLRSSLPVGLAAYGRLPLMVLRRCPLSNACQSGGVCPGVLTDRTSRKFPLRCHGSYRELLNAHRLWTADRLPELYGAHFLSLLLHEESPGEAAAVVRAYREGGSPPPEHTRGLLTRGVQ